MALLACCPTLHKLGQVLARDPRLDPVLRRRLQTLESLPGMTDPALVRQALNRELGELPVELEDRVLAQASVAVVVPFIWREGRGVQQGVFKLLKPGVEERLEEELAHWPALGDHLAERSRVYGLPVPDYREILEGVRELLRHEIDLTREQAHLREAADLYARMPRVKVPALLPFCTPRVTAMERVYGVKVTEARGTLARRRLAETLIQALLARPFWDAEEVLFHADPHAGNLLATSDGRLAILDWSLGTRLSRRRKEAVVTLILGGLLQDVEQLCRGVAGLGRIDPRQPQLLAAARFSLAQVRRGRFPGLEWLLDLLDRVALESDIRFDREMVLFRKALLTLSGVLGDLSPGHGGDRVLLEAGLQRLWQEWPTRLTAGSGRRFATHLSNADLLGLWLAVGPALVRHWQGRWRDNLVWLGGDLASQSR